MSNFKTTTEMEPEKTLHNKFELESEGMSLQARQAAAFLYLKGYLSMHFKVHDELSLVNYRYIRQEIVRLLGVDLLTEDKG